MALKYYVCSRITRNTLLHYPVAMLLENIQLKRILSYIAVGLISLLYNVSILVTNFENKISHSMKLAAAKRFGIIIPLD